MADDWTSIYADRPVTDITPAEPIPTWSEYFGSSEHLAHLTTMGDVSQNAALEEAYDGQIKEIKTVTGVELPHPMRGGYALEARRSIRNEVIAGNMAPIDEQGGIPQRQRQLFDQKAREIQQANPLLQLGNVEDDARNIAKGAIQDYAHVSSSVGGPGTAARFILDTAAGMYAGRRNPMFWGSLFAGPSTAVGKIALARIAMSAVGLGGANVLQSLAQSPSVQAWRGKLGMETGVIPTLEEAAWAGVSGMIPGAGFQALGEAGRVAAPALRRLIKGRGEPGDVKTVTEAMPVPEPVAKAMQFGEDAIEADKEILPTHEQTQAQTKLPIDESLHNDMMGAELKRADNPEEPSAAAVHAIDDLQRPPEEPRAAAPTEEAATTAMDPDARAAMQRDIEERVKAERPKTLREAQQIADEVITDHARANGIANTEEAIETERTARAELAATTEKVERDPGDKMGLVPWVADDGKPRLVTEKHISQLGADEDRLAELVRACV